MSIISIVTPKQVNDNKAIITRLNNNNNNAGNGNNNNSGNNNVYVHNEKTNNMILHAIGDFHNQLLILVKYFTRRLFKLMKDRILDVWSTYPMNTQSIHNNNNNSNNNSSSPSIATTDKQQQHKDNEFVNLFNLLKVIYCEPIHFELENNAFISFFSNSSLSPLSSHTNNKSNRFNLDTLKIPIATVLHDDEKCMNAIRVIIMNAEYVFGQLIENKSCDLSKWIGCKYNAEIEKEFNRKEYVSDIIIKVMYIGINFGKNVYFENSLICCCSSLQNLILYIDKQYDMKQMMAMPNKNRSLKLSSASLDDIVTYDTRFLVEIIDIIKKKQFYDYMSMVKPVNIYLKRKKQQQQQ
jgi:hypothetical protein